MNEIPTLFTFRQFAGKHQAFSVPALRWTRFKKDSNGFKAAFVSVGRRVLVDENEFFRVIAEQNGQGPEAA